MHVYINQYRKEYVQQYLCLHDVASLPMTLLFVVECIVVVWYTQKDTVPVLLIRGHLYDFHCYLLGKE